MLSSVPYTSRERMTVSWSPDGEFPPSMPVHPKPADLIRGTSEVYLSLPNNIQLLAKDENTVLFTEPSSPFWKKVQISNWIDFKFGVWQRLWLFFKIYIYLAHEYFGLRSPWLLNVFFFLLDILYQAKNIWSASWASSKSVHESVCRSVRKPNKVHSACFLSTLSRCYLNLNHKTDATDDLERFNKQDIPLMNFRTLTCS